MKSSSSVSPISPTIPTKSIKISEEEDFTGLVEPKIFEGFMICKGIKSKKMLIPVKQMVWHLLDKSCDGMRDSTVTGKTL